MSSLRMSALAMAIRWRCAGQRRKVMLPHLAAGELDALVANHGLIALFKLCDEVVGVRLPCGFLNGLL